MVQKYPVLQLTRRTGTHRPDAARASGRVSSLSEAERASQAAARATRGSCRAARAGSTSSVPPRSVGASPGVAQPALGAARRAGRRRRRRRSGPARAALDLHLDLGAGRRARAGRRWRPPPAAPAAAGRRPRAGTAVSTGPEVRTTGREAQHRDVLADQRADLGAQRVACSVLQLEDRAADRLDRVVEVGDGLVEPVARPRGPPVIAATPWSCRPVAKSRWMTTSCRSRAIRSRSEISASSCAVGDAPGRGPGPAPPGRRTSPAARAPRRRAGPAGVGRRPRPGR